MSNFEFSDLKDLVDTLYDTFYLPSNGKIKLIELFEDVLKLEGKKKVQKR
ncbi:MAG: hypothetical protein ACR5KV_04415 [Wolbachia sp.]